MKSLSIFLALTISHSLVWALPTNMPIYIADSFWPPNMNFLAWLPGEDFCCSGVPIVEGKFFSIGGTDGLNFKGYWSEGAELTRYGKPYADCRIGPDSVKQGACPQHKDALFAGPVNRRWSCWVIGKGKVYDEIGEDQKGGTGTQPGPNRPYWED